MTVTARPASQPKPTALSPGSAAVAGGAFTKFNPENGILLEALHFDLMQRYASDLASAVGAGLGPGVVYGFGCTLSPENDEVRVTGGLAFGNGRPLRSTEPVTVSLRDLTPAGDEFWVVEIVPAEWDFGSQPVYGSLCDDPCERGAGIRPYGAEGVELRLRRDSIDDFGDVPKERRRNFLASKCFERERQYGGESSRSANAPWLMPDVPGGDVQQPITRRPWPEGTGPYGAAAVPLGVVWKDDDEWQLDVWTARRDLGDPTPMMAWQWRLAWRPRSVFMAQILQFQAHLAERELGRERKLSQREKAFRELCETASTKLSHGRSQLTKDVKADLDKYQELFDDEEPPSLTDLGFDELPPAGYLPVSFTSLQEAEAAALVLFGEHVDVRVRFCRADYVAHAVEQVQHMDRIPLTDAATTPKIDLLVPQVNLTDLKATLPRDSYGWSAFVRRRDDEPQRRDYVKVYVWQPGQGDGLIAFVRNRLAEPGRERFLDQLLDLGTVSYPADEWGVPTDEPPIGEDSIWQHVQDLLAKDMKVFGVVGVEHTAERQPLAAARASLFVIPAQEAGNPIELPDTYALVELAWPVSIIIVLTPVSPPIL